MALPYIRSGFDLVEVPRFRKALARHPRLVERICTPAEAAYCRSKADPVPCLAARWAAKEAVAKLLGTGILDWHEIEIVSDRPPRVVLRGTTAERARVSGIGRIGLSLTHTARAAAASAVAPAEPEGETSRAAVWGRDTVLRPLALEERPFGLSPEQVRELDRATIAEVGVPGPVLMERAALGVAEVILRRYPRRHTLIVCGRGNNGGDGLAAARVLHLAGHPVACVVAAASAEELSGDAALNLRAAQGAGVNLRMGTVPDYLWDETELVVDCLLGTGAAGELRGTVREYARRIGAVAARGVPVVAVDVPTGVDAGSGRIAADTVVADVTVTFHAAKTGLLCPPGSEAAGEVLVWDIGIPGFLMPDPVVRVVTAAEAAVPGRRPDDHKYRAGFVVVVAGSRDYPGAAYLAATAAVRCGAGYVRLVTSPEAAAALRGRLVEVVVAEAGPDDGFAPATDARAGALVVGPGLGRDPQTAAAVRRLLAGTAAPAVLDADGLLAYAGEAEILRARAGLVLTPHAGELAALLGVSATEVSEAPLAAARRAAEVTGQVVVLKGSSTVIAAQEGPVWVVAQGPPQLASAGTGDVLSGCIGALLAKGMMPLAAAKSGVWLHAEAGRRGAALHPQGLAAGDLVESLSLVAAEHVYERRPGWST